MSQHPSDDDKQARLKAAATLHPHPEAVSDPGFTAEPFFDARDLLQVKYEMLRKVDVEGASVSAAAAAFGLSRPTFYQAREAFERDGLPGLLPAKKGPQRRHKVTAEVLAWLDTQLAERPDTTPTQLAEAAHDALGIALHPRTFRRVLEERRKKA